MMDELHSNYSNDDEIEFIQKKTGFDMKFINFLLWQKYCYEMELGLWEYDIEKCIFCGDGPLLFKEISNKEFAEKIVCKNFSCEMVIGEDGLEKFGE